MVGRKLQCMSLEVCSCCCGCGITRIYGLVLRLLLLLLLTFFLPSLPFFSSLSHNQQQLTQISHIPLSTTSITTIHTYIVRGSSFAHGHRCFLDRPEALWLWARGSLVPFSQSSRKQILVQIYLLFPRPSTRVGAFPHHRLAFEIAP